MQAFYHNNGGVSGHINLTLFLLFFKGVHEEESAQGVVGQGLIQSSF